MVYRFREICGTAAFVLLWTGCSTTIGTVIKKYGYSELRPPNTYVGPGTVYAVRSGRIEDIVCSSEGSVGKDFVSLLSPTSSGELVSKAKGEFKLDASLLDQIKADAEGKYVKTVKLKTSNMSLRTASDDQVVAGVKKRTADCWTAILTRQAAGERLTMVNSVLVGDVDYSVEFDKSATLNAETKKRILDKVAITLGGTVGISGSSVVTGKELFWGSHDSQMLMKYGKAPTQGIVALGSLGEGGRALPPVIEKANPCANPGLVTSQPLLDGCVNDCKAEAARGRSGCKDAGCIGGVNNFETGCIAGCAGRANEAKRLACWH